jgi:hypothetical protein
MLWPTSPVSGSEPYLVKVLMKYPEGRGRDLPAKAKSEIEAIALSQGLDLFQAFSLRRQLLKSRAITNRKPVESLNLGSMEGQQNYADLFEAAVGEFLKVNIDSQYLKQSDIQNLISAEKKKRIEQTGKSPEELMKMWIPLGGNDFQGPCCICLTTIIRRTSINQPICRECDKIKITVCDGLSISQEHQPDFVFLKPVTINGVSVQWIDCKAFYGSNIMQTRKGSVINKISNQVSRYNRCYGKGAILFLRGFHKKLSLDCLILDCTPLDISAFNGE